MKIMKKNANEKIMMLQYRIKRYHAMGNGTMCQTLNGQLQKLLSKQIAMYTHHYIICNKSGESEKVLRFLFIYTIHLCARVYYKLICTVTDFNPSR